MHAYTPCTLTHTLTLPIHPSIHTPMYTHPSNTHCPYILTQPTIHTLHTYTPHIYSHTPYTPTHIHLFTYSCTHSSAFTLSQTHSHILSLCLSFHTHTHMHTHTQREREIPSLFPLSSAKRHFSRRHFCSSRGLPSGQRDVLAAASEGAGRIDARALCTS
jgi:hypothetical protein